MNSKVKPYFRFIVFLVCIFFIINLIPQKDAIYVNSFQKTQSLNIVSKSGAGDNYPQNVASSFSAAANLGIRHFELGVVLSSDNELIIADTTDLSYYTGEEGNITDFTYSELRNKNFAYNYTSDNGLTYPYREQNILCIKLETLFSTYYNSDFIINVVQQGDEGVRTAKLLCELIRKYDFTTRIVIKGDSNVVDYIRSQTNVTVLTCASPQETKLFATMAKIGLSNLIFSMKYQYVEIAVEEIDNYSIKVVKALQNRNVCIYISGIKTTEEKEKAELLNADGIISNDVEHLLTPTVTE